MLGQKIALVIGASRGIGAGVARELASQGAHVILAARTLDGAHTPTFGENGPPLPGSLLEHVEVILSKGGQAEPYAVDLLDREAIREMLESIASRHGRLDILVNCAMGLPAQYKGEIWNSDDTEWRAMMDVGVRGKYLAIHHASKIMRSQGSGLIVNISAGAAHMEYYSPVFRIAMAAVDRMTKAVAFDLRDDNVACVSIWPRWVRTEWVLMAAQDASLGIAVSQEDLAESDSPEFTGRAIAYLAADPKILSRSGEILPVVSLAHDYGFSDIDGSRPALHSPRQN